MMLPFFKETVFLISEMMKQGGKINRLPSTLNKFLGRHFDVSHKYKKHSYQRDPNPLFYEDSPYIANPHFQILFNTKVISQQFWPQNCFLYFYVYF